MSLLHLQEDIEIPEVNIVVHPVVKQLIAKVCLFVCRFWLVWAALGPFLCVSEC